MAIHREPQAGSTAAPLPIACRSSPCWRRGHLASWEQHHHPGSAWFVLVTTGQPDQTGLTGAAMGSGRPWRRCSAGRSWIGWASQRAALTAAITAANVDDSTTFGAVLEDVPPIHTPSGRRPTRPAKVNGDKGYDTRPTGPGGGGDGSPHRSPGVGSVVGLAWAPSGGGPCGVVMAELLTPVGVRGDRNLGRWFAFVLLAVQSSASTGF